MDIVSIVLASLASGSALAVAFAFLSRSLIGHFLAKDAEKYRVQLEEAAKIRSFRFERLHDLRAQKTAELYARVNRAKVAAESYVSLVTYPGTSPEEERAKHASIAANDFIQFFFENEILFDKDTCVKVEKLVVVLRDVLITFGEKNYYRDDDKKEYHRLWTEAYNKLKSDFVEAETQVKEEFRQILGVNF